MKTALISGSSKIRPQYELYLCFCRKNFAQKRNISTRAKGDEVYITNYFALFEGAYEMFAAAPRELLFKYPLAYLQYIGMLLLSGDPETTRDGANRLHELQTFYETPENIPLDFKNRILAGG